MDRFSRIAKYSRHVPIVRQCLESYHRKRFNAATGEIRLFRGIYPDFASAAAEIPKSRLEGYDNDPSALRLAHERLRVYPSDYPILFWLSRLLPECRLLFDWGGNVGISYFGYRKYLDYPAGLAWLVCDVPAVAALGAKIAAEESAPGLGFTTSLDRLCDAELLLAAGSLHFIENAIQPLREARKLPPRILLNKVPAYELPSAVTLHNMGSALCPYHLFNKSAFVRQFTALGYRLIDEWDSSGLGCEIPFFPEHSIAAYSGFYFSNHATDMRRS
jgi:putative methyltransferase (TIGR04325 family)